MCANFKNFIIRCAQIKNRNFSVDIYVAVVDGLYFVLPEKIATLKVNI